MSVELTDLYDCRLCSCKQYVIFFRVMVECSYRKGQGADMQIVARSLFQKRIAMELEESLLPGQEDKHVVFSPVNGSGTGVTFALCDRDGRVVEGTPPFGCFRISLHAYDVYPFNHADEAVLAAIDALYAFIARVSAARGRSTHHAS